MEVVSRERRRVQVDCGGISRTEQHHKNACDINRVVKKYNQTGILQQRLQKGVYGDFTSFEDYHSSVEKMLDAFNDFMAVPSHIRKRFGNDPGKLIEFVHNDDNYDEAVELGLIPKKPVEPEPEPPAPPLDDG